MICRVCGKEKQQIQFNFRRDTNKLRTECKACLSVRYKARYYKTPEKFRSYSRARHQNLKGVINAKRRGKEYLLNLLYKRYSISAEDYKNLLEKQEGRCGICRVQRELLCADHEHSSGKVRGLLCKSCNFGLGHFKDDADRCLSAYNYLRPSEMKEFKA